MVYYLFLEHPYSLLDNLLFLKKYNFLGLDCFCSHLGKSGVDHATKLAHLFNVTSDRMFHLVEERSPTLTQTKEAIKIGRVQLPKQGCNY